MRVSRSRFATRGAFAGVSSALLGLVVGSCGLGDGVTLPSSTASIAVRTAFSPVTAPSSLVRSQIDLVRVLVIRPSTGEVLDQAEEPVTVGQQSVPLELSVELEESPEELLVRVELWSGDVLAYAGEELMLVDAALSVNESPEILLEPTSPSLDVQPPSLAFTLDPGAASSSQLLTIRNTGAGDLSWQASSDVSWLTVSPTIGSIAEGGTTTALATVSVAGLSSGDHRGSITIVAPGAVGSPQNVIVDLVVSAGQPPTADAGPDQTVVDSDRSGDEPVGLDGTGSFDPDGTIVSWVWTEGGTQIATGEDPVVTLPVGVHVITLTVTDDGGLTGTDQVQITVAVPANQPPTADAGPDQTVTDSDRSGDEPVGLDGTGSFDPDGTIVSWVWTDGGTQIATGADPVVTLPVGVHVITLTVTDDGGLTGTDQVQITVAVPANQPPTADAGPDQTVTDSDRSGDEPVGLDGTGSFDPDGTIVSWVWTESGTQIAMGEDPVVTLPVGVHVITLTVTDDGGLTGTDLVQITVVALQAPTADAGPDQTVVDSDNSGDESVTLDGTGSFDPDGTIVSWVWTESGTQIATGATPTVAFDLGSYTIVLTVTDNDGLTDTDAVQITVVAPALPDLVIPTGPPTVTPSSVVAGGSVTLSAWDVLNQGSASSGSFSNGFFLSTDAVITAGDVYLSGNSNGSLAPGASFSWGGPTLTIPSGTAPGNYFIGILVDRTDAVSESDEGNNYVSSPLTVTAATGSVGGRVFSDLNTNNLFDGNDQPLPGVTVTLDLGGAILNALTDAAGNYMFIGVTPGSYTVTVSGAPPSYAYGGSIPLPVPVTVTAGSTSVVNFPFDVVNAAPTISNLSIRLIQVNDTVNCSNSGSSYDADFDFTDPDGDVTQSVATIRDDYVFSGGASGTLVWPGAGYYSVTGSGFSGSVSVILCTRFSTNTSVTDSFTVEDGAGNLSNALTAIRNRPAGGNAPPPEQTTAPSHTGALRPGR